ncbi:MAG: DUF4174 domain-containing protein [Pseudomonadota bacterium]
MTLCSFLLAEVCLVASAQSFRLNSYRYLAVCEQPVDGHQARFVEPARALVSSADGQDRRLALIALTATGEPQFFLNGDEVSESLARELRRVAFNTRCEPTDNYVDLIGLDGSIKMTWWDAFPDSIDLYALIDSMPMRRREMRDRDD